MIEKLKKNKFLIGIIIISLIYLILTSVQNPNFNYNLKDDDVLIVESASSLLNFKWLGDFKGSLLAKGIGAPLFIAIINIIGLKFTQAHFLFYMGGAILLAFVLKKIIKNNFVNLLVFTVILFNPMIYSSDLLRVYRDGIYASSMLYVIACVFGIFFNYKEEVKKLVPYMIGLGIFGTFMAITREETLWIAPFVLGSGIITSLFMIFDKKCEKKKTKITLYLIPVLIYLITIIFNMTMNKIYYKEFIRIEENTKAFKDFVKAASSVDVENPDIRVPISKETRQKLYEVSPSFQKLRLSFDNPNEIGFEQYGVSNYEIEDGWLMWAVFYALDNHNLTDNAKTMNDYLRQITSEINEAFEDGRLEKEDNPASIFDKENFDELTNNILMALDFQVTSKRPSIKIDVDLMAENTQVEVGKVTEFNEVTGNISTSPLTYNYKVDNIKVEILKAIASLYEICSKNLFYVGLLIYLLLIIRFLLIKPRFGNYKELLVLTGLLVLYFTRIFVIAYTHTAKFPAINIAYLGVTYSVQYMFEILALVFGISEIIKIFKNIKNKK